MSLLLERLADGAVSLSAILAVILLLRRPLADLVGAVAVYRLWLLVPLHLGALWLIGPPQPGEAAPMALTLQPLVVPLEAASGPMVSAWSVIVWTWGVGAMVAMAGLLRDVMRSRRLCQDSFDPATTGQDVDTASRTRVSRSIQIPVVAGLVRSIILIPEDFAQRYTAAEQRLILQHETAHLRRRDNLFNLLARLVTAVFWFNPLVHLAHGAYRRDQELSVDALVLRHAGVAERKTYGRALIKSVIGSRSPQLTSSWQSRNSLKERTLMLNSHRSTPARTAAGMILLTAFSAGAVGLSADAVAIDREARAPTARAPLSPLERVLPQYPRDAAEQRLEGHVVMELTVDADGQVRDVIVVESHPQGVFDDAARIAMEQWRFAPPVLQDGASTITAVQTLHFELDAPAPPPAPPAPHDPSPAVDPAPAPLASPAPPNTLSVIPAAWSIAVDDC